MKITGYRTLQTIHDWGRPVGDVNGHIASGITEVPVVIVDTNEGVSGVGTGSHQDLAQIFPAIEGEDPRAVSALYDRMLARVFKASHAGATFGGIGTFDMALWDTRQNSRASRFGACSGGAIALSPGMRPDWISRSMMMNSRSSIPTWRAVDSRAGSSRAAETLPATFAG